MLMREKFVSFPSHHHKHETKRTPAFHVFAMVRRARRVEPRPGHSCFDASQVLLYSCFVLHLVVVPKSVLSLDYSPAAFNGCSVR